MFSIIILLYEHRSQFNCTNPALARVVRIDDLHHCQIKLFDIPPFIFVAQKTCGKRILR